MQFIFELQETINEPDHKFRYCTYSKQIHMLEYSKIYTASINLTKETLYFICINSGTNISWHKLKLFALTGLFSLAAVASLLVSYI